MIKAIWAAIRAMLASFVWVLQWVGGHLRLVRKPVDPVASAQNLIERAPTPEEKEAALERGFQAFRDLVRHEMGLGPHPNYNAVPHFLRDWTTLLSRDQCAHVMTLRREDLSRHIAASRGRGDVTLIAGLPPIPDGLTMPRTQKPAPAPTPSAGNTTKSSSGGGMRHIARERDVADRAGSKPMDLSAALEEALDELKLAISPGARPRF